MADKTTELERVYTIPLRKAKDLTRSRRADNAVRDVRRFLARHMKSETIWLDASVNEALWGRGKYTIPSKLRVRATRFSDGVVEVTLPEATVEGSVRTQLAERREKAAEKPVLKAAEAEEGEEARPGADRPVTDVKGIGPAMAEKLAKAGVESLADLAEQDPANVMETVGGSIDRAKSWVADAKAILGGDIEKADKEVQPELAADLEAAAKEAEESDDGEAGDAEDSDDGETPKESAADAEPAAKGAESKGDAEKKD